MAIKHILSPQDLDQDTIVRQAQAAVTKGQVCKYYTDFLQVVPLATTDLLDAACGVATHDAAAGAQVRLVKSGVVQTLVDGTTDIAIGERVVSQGTLAGVLAKDGTVAVADVATCVFVLEAQTADAATLTYCKVNF